MEKIHGHELINLIVRKEKEMSLQEIKETAVKDLGQDVSYYTCSNSSMTTDEMINFLLVRHKLIKKDNGYVINSGEVCNHDN